MNKYLSFLPLFLCILQPLHPQSKFDYASLKEKYRNDPLCFLYIKRIITVDIEGDHLKIKEKNESERLFLSETSSSLYASQTIPYYDESQEISGIEACTYVPVKNKFRKIPVKETGSRKPVKEGIFYDDYHEKYFFLPGVEPGAVGHISYTETLKDPHFMGSIYFNLYVPLLSHEISVSFPKEVVVKYIFLGDSSGVHFSSRTSSGRTTYTWSGFNLPKLKTEEGAPDISYYAPHLFLYIEQYTIAGKTTHVFSDTDQLYKWYYSLVKDINKNPDSSLVKFTLDLVSGCRTAEEKIKRIFYWVQDNIKYIAFEDGLGGFIPREASRIHERKYGDCKDKASLMVTMLRIAGIPAWPCWIGTRDIPYSYSMVPLPASDNHMIAAVKVHDEWIFLDGTAENLPYPLPSSAIQGKEGLIGIDSLSYVIEKVPVVKSEINAWQDSIIISLKDNLLQGEGSTNISGLWKTNVVNAYSGYSLKERNEKMSGMLSVGSNKFLMDSLSCRGFENKDSLLSFNFFFTLPDYTRKIDDNIYINMNLNRIMQAPLIDTLNRVYDKENNMKYTFRNIVSLRIPEGYRISGIPEKSEYRNENFGFRISYSTDKDFVTMEQFYYSDFLVLGKKYFSEWNCMTSAAAKAYKNTVVLSKIR